MSTSTPLPGSTAWLEAYLRKQVANHPANRAEAQDLTRHDLSVMRGEVARFTKAFAILSGLPEGTDTQTVIDRAGYLLELAEGERALDDVLAPQTIELCKRNPSGGPAQGFADYMAQFARHVIKLNEFAAQADHNAPRMTPGAAAYNRLLNYADNLNAFAAASHAAIRQADAAGAGEVTNDAILTGWDMALRIRTGVTGIIAREEQFRVKAG